VRLAGTAFDAADDFVGRDVRFDAIVRGKCFFNSLSVSRLKVHVIVCHSKKLLFIVASIGVFTLNGVSP
jgi:hypothetical protein